MKACTFFGHRDASREVEEKLCRAIEDLIIQEKVSLFYVGNQGNFDSMVKRLLEEYMLKFPHIEFFVVTAYPTAKNKELSSNYIYPLLVRGISERNLWMIKNSDYVVTYVTRFFGGAASFKRQALKQGKRIMELS